MNEQDKKILEEFKRNLPLEAKKHLKKLIAYGSRARGDFREDSDLDAVALVDEKSPALDNTFDDVVYDVMLNHDFKPIISLRVFSESNFHDMLKRGYSFYQNVDQEGIAI